MGPSPPAQLRMSNDDLKFRINENHSISPTVPFIMNLDSLFGAFVSSPTVNEQVTIDGCYV